MKRDLYAYEKKPTYIDENRRTIVYKETYI